MSHDHSKELTIKDMKRQEQRVQKGMLGCHPKLGGALTKIGTHPHKTKEILKYGGWFFTLLPRSVTACGQTAAELALNKNDTTLKGKKGTLNSVFRNDKELFRDNSDNTDNFAQAAMFNATTTLHTTRQVQQHRPVNFTQAQASTTSPATWLHTSPCFDNFNFNGCQGAPTPYLQQPTTTFRETVTHLRNRLISPMSVGLTLIVYYHFTLYRHNKPYWLLRYVTI